MAYAKSSSYLTHELQPGGRKIEPSMASNECRNTFTEETKFSFSSGPSQLLMSKCRSSKNEVPKRDTPSMLDDVLDVHRHPGKVDSTSLQMQTYASSDTLPNVTIDEFVPVKKRIAKGSLHRLVSADTPTNAAPKKPSLDGDEKTAIEMFSLDKHDDEEKVRNRIVHGINDVGSPDMVGSTHDENIESDVSQTILPLTGRDCQSASSQGPQEMTKRSRIRKRGVSSERNIATRETKNPSQTIRASHKDFLCISSGKRSWLSDQPGNVELKRLISLYAPKYRQTQDGEEKREVVESVLHDFSSIWGGRMLRPARSGQIHPLEETFWYAMKQDTAREFVRKSISTTSTKHSVANFTATDNCVGSMGSNRIGSINKPEKEDHLCISNIPLDHGKNPGDLLYHDLIKSRAQSYSNAATNDRKLSIRMLILKKFRESSGRLLSSKDGGTTWIELDEDTALKTIAKDLLDYKNEEDEREERKVEVASLRDTVVANSNCSRVTVLKPDDCLCLIGYKKDQQTHPGVLEFYKLIEEHNDLYWEPDTTYDGKRSIREKVVKEFLGTGGRFVAPVNGKNVPGCKWEVVDDDSAAKKVWNAFRSFRKRALKEEKESIRRREQRNLQQKPDLLHQYIKSSDDEAAASEAFDEGCTTRDSFLIPDGLQKNDFLFSRSGKSMVQFHHGNEAFKSMIDRNSQRYHDCRCNADAQKAIKESILSALHSYGGRFLVQRKGSESWDEVDDKSALRKIHRLLRDTVAFLRPKQVKYGLPDVHRSSCVFDASYKQIRSKRRKRNGSNSPSGSIALGDFEGSLLRSRSDFHRYEIETDEEYSDVEELNI